MMKDSLGARPSVDSLANRVRLSPSRLSQLFKAETGMSPMQYLRTLRMRQAEDLLQTTFLSVKEIAFLSGASDVSHFVRDFKRHFGLTPSEFRDERLSLKQASQAGANGE